MGLEPHQPNRNLNLSLKAIVLVENHIPFLEAPNDCAGQLNSIVRSLTSPPVQARQYPSSSSTLILMVSQERAGATGRIGSIAANRAQNHQICR